MKIDRHDCQSFPNRNSSQFAKRYCLAGLLWVAVSPMVGSCQSVRDKPVSAENQSATQLSHAEVLIARVIGQIALGESFDAKVRQRVWVSGREVVGVGTYEQAGQESGRFNLQITMHDGDGKHMLQQVSDGRLAWTREEIGGEVTLRRVDVGRLDQWINDSFRSSVARSTDLKVNEVSASKEDERSSESVESYLASQAFRSSLDAVLRPSIRVGGWTEMLERIVMDHDLSLATGTLEGRDVWILRGRLRPEIRQQRLNQFCVAQNVETTTWPELCPSQVVIAIAKSPDPETDFGQGLPLRIEFWSDPVKVSEAQDVGTIEPEHMLAQSTVVGDSDPNARSPMEATQSSSIRSGVPKSFSAEPVALANSRLISLIELYSIRPISPPPVERFRFDNLDIEVNFTNETDRYLSRYGIRLTERQNLLLRR